MTEVLNKNDKGRYDIFFKSNQGKTEIYFKKFRDSFYEPVIKSSKNTTRIPLLLEVPDIIMTLKKLYDVKVKNGNLIYNYDLLTNIVTGACLISIKTSGYRFK